MSENNSPILTLKINDAGVSELAKLEVRLEKIIDLMKQIGLVEVDKSETAKFESNKSGSEIASGEMYLGEEPKEYNPGIENERLKTAIDELTCKLKASKILIVQHLLDIKNQLVDIKHKKVNET